MIDRHVKDFRLRSVRPSPPTVRQELLGVLGMFLLIVFIDRFCTYVNNISFGGLIYLVAIIFVACWAGLRSALASCCLLIAYAWIIYHTHISGVPTDYSPGRASRAIIGTAIFFPIFAITAGVVQNRFRAAALREYDALVAAEEELEQRKIAEAELGTSEEMRRLIVDSSIDAIIGVSEEGMITLWNPNAEKLFGWTQEEAIGSPVGKRVLSPKTGDSRQTAMLKFFESGTGPVLREQIELTARTKSQKEVALEVYIADHKTKDGSIFIIFARDISDRKRAEQAIRELNASLEGRVAERTKQLEAANSELLGFTYSVSHDLRTPLRAIVSNSRIVREEAQDTLGEESSENLKRLESNALKMAELIENLLQFARIGQVQLRLRNVDLSAMAQDIADELRAGKAGTIQIQPGMSAEGDPEMIRMVMFNLLENAWKYVKPGEAPSVEVGVNPEGIFFVRDQGIGFDMKYVDKIWEPFERLHRDSEYSGTGIGLANSKRIVARHGGRIWAESVPGKGTTMYFELGESTPARLATK